MNDNQDHFNVKKIDDINSERLANNPAKIDVNFVESILNKKISYKM